MNGSTFVKSINSRKSRGFLRSHPVFIISQDIHFYITDLENSAYRIRILFFFWWLITIGLMMSINISTPVKSSGDSMYDRHTHIHTFIGVLFWLSFENQFIVCSFLFLYQLLVLPLCSDGGRMKLKIPFSWSFRLEMLSRRNHIDRWQRHSK